MHIVTFPDEYTLYLNIEVTVLRVRLNFEFYMFHKDINTNFASNLYLVTNYFINLFNLCLEKRLSCKSH